MILEGKTVVVSGVGPGLGREVAACALRDGANVVVAARTESKLASVAKELDPSGERVLAHAADITDYATCEALMQATVDRFGALDAVVNVAALDTLFGTLESTSDDDWRRSLEMNILGTMHVARSATPHLEASGGGAIVLIGSQAMWLPPKMPQMAYGAAKGAILSAMYPMANELGPKKIRVNMVIPTWMWGPPVEMYMNWQAKERDISVDEAMAEVVDNMPLGEMPADEDVAEAVVFFCSDRSRMITGETLMVNAGELYRD
ncbi:MAG: SDR family oxidoreductase [Deltaproteobacteria bacterium]|nr:SDR family oxidoreductase [Deltaproteobacteria bacterium]MBW2447316.1 SDR family oxidoreductase [Deltaproteobacteria bacterium]